MTERMANRIWHRNLLSGHISWGFTGWEYARLIAVDINPSMARIEVFGHYISLYR